MGLRIVTYDEIDPEQAMEIDQACFGGTYTPERVGLLRRLDRQCSDYLALYALNDEGQAVSQVVVFHIDTETTEGREKIAGIAAVGTLPGYSRKGMSTELMNRAHELSRDRGIRIALLTTSAYLVAYEMYAKLGYSTLVTFERGHKRLTKKHGGTKGLKLRRFSLRDTATLDEIFNAHNKGRLGFVHRPPGFIEMKVKTHQLSPIKVKVATLKGRPIGYLRGESDADTLSLDELVAIDESWKRAILREFEGNSKAQWSFCHGFHDQRLFELYESEGYKMHMPGWGRVMAAGIDGSLSSEDIKNLYGVNQYCFVIYPLDAF